MIHGVDAAGSEAEQPPLPYAGHHHGPRRVLTLSAPRPGLASGTAMLVTVDGLAHPLPWGTVRLEVPADRPVSLAVHAADSRGSFAGLGTTILTPDADPALEYRIPRGRATGEIGPPGTARPANAWAVAGRWGCAILVVATVLLMLAALVLPIVLA